MTSERVSWRLGLVELRAPVFPPPVPDTGIRGSRRDRHPSRIFRLPYLAGRRFARTLQPIALPSRMNRFLALIPDVLLVLGLLAVAVGAGLVFFPAGLIVGGVEAAALGTVLDGRTAPEADA